MNQNLSKISVDAPVSVFICMGKITPRNVTSNSHMIEFLFHYLYDGVPDSQYLKRKYEVFKNYLPDFALKNIH